MRTGEYGKVPIDPERPWPGLLSFPEAAARLFHGRTREITELLRLVESEPIAFLYGKSGLGKTSLLQAGLFPKLRERDRLPVYVRLTHGESAPPATQQVFASITQALDAAGADGPRPAPADTLWGYLHRRDVEWWSARNHPLRLVLVFDQFEEIFTLGQATPALRTPAAETLDALQELTTARPGAAQRVAFEARPELVETHDYDAARYAVLFSFREDFLPQFDQLRERLRINPHNRLMLEHLSGEGACESVLGTGGTLVDAPMAEAIVRFVAGDETEHPRPLGQLDVEPWLLSLVCEQLNERRLRQHPAPGQIARDLLTGSRDEILSDYYRSCISAFDPRVSAFLEDRLLTEGGFRTPYPYAEAIRLDGITPAIVEQLVDARLVRREEHLGSQRLEVTHDVLGPVMLRYREQRLGQEREALARVRAISEKRRAAEGRRRSGLMVVVATAVMTVLSAFAWLRAREAANARLLARWGQETQRNAYEGMLQLVRQRPLSNAVLQAVRGLRSSTQDLRQTFPRDVRLLAHEVQFTYLMARAMADSGISRADADTVLLLADSLVQMRGVEAEPSVAEFAFRLATITARETGNPGRANIFLQHRAALVDAPTIADFNREQASAAAVELSYFQRDRATKLELLQRAARGYSRLGESTPERALLDSLSAAASALAIETRQDPGSSTELVRSVHGLVASAHQLKVDESFAVMARDTTNMRARRRLASDYGNLGYWSLLAGDFAQSLEQSTMGLRFDSTANWIEQNRHHAMLFLGRFDEVVPLVRRWYHTPLTNNAGSYRDAALQDLQAFREARLSHADLARYEALFREPTR